VVSASGGSLSGESENNCAQRHSCGSFTKLKGNGGETGARPTLMAELGLKRYRIKVQMASQPSE
jgi:hypothetical protein